MPRSNTRQSGFTYLGALILIAMISVAATATLKLGAAMQRRAAEEQLLAIGGEFRDAFLSYANSTPPGQPRTPASLQDLLKDPRFPTVRRHLRRIYVDPISGKPEWGIIPAQPGPGIMGVYSLADGTPIKVANFELRFQDFEGKTTYQDWVFMPPPETLVPLSGGVGVSAGAGAGASLAH
jgi:type II secretory pathway pseudopilin PulG